MSAITKCDICGEIYNEDTVPASVSSIRITEYYERTGSRHDKDTDLCPKCTKKLKEFIPVLKSSANLLK
jgi:hypothetical protein